MRRLLSLAAASILLALPAAAHANLDLGDRAVAAAISAGESVWQDNPCAGQTTYRYLTDEQVVAEHPDDPDSARIVGYAPISGAYRGNCTVTLASQRAWTASDLCMVVAHEHGHLLGLQHTDDGNDLMYPYLGDGVTIYGCQDLTELAARQLVDVQITVSVIHRAKPKRAPVAALRTAARAASRSPSRSGPTGVQAPDPVAGGDAAPIFDKGTRCPPPAPSQRSAATARPPNSSPWPRAR